MSRGSKRMTPHTGTEIRARLLREAAVREYWTMGESLIQPRRVQEEGLMGCKLLLYKKKKPFTCRGLKVPNE
jgi:hypothetical protein